MGKLVRNSASRQNNFGIMSESVDQEFEVVKALFRKWVRVTIPVLQDVKQECPPNLEALDDLLRDKTEDATRDYRVGILRSFQALGADTAALESKLDDLAATKEDIEEEFESLAKAIPTSGSLIHDWRMNLPTRELSN